MFSSLAMGEKGHFRKVCLLNSTYAGRPMSHGKTAEVVSLGACTVVMLLLI